MRAAKTKALISCAVTAQLICVFVFAYARSRFSHDAAQMVKNVHILDKELHVVYLSQHQCKQIVLGNGNYHVFKI